ncbi:MAG: IclR family transcriptional regulator [Anaerolineae bacterium]|nr:IclR family transcriptional regulator [Anaerolineae bacterium]
MSQALARGLRILQQFSLERPEWTLSELGEATNLPLPTVHRLLRTLMAYRFVEQDPATRRFRLGSGVVQLIGPALHALRLPEIARPYVRQLSDALGETANLAILEGAQVLYLVSYASPCLLRVQTYVGLLLPAHCTALGKCLLAYLDEEEARARLGPEPYPARTPFTKTRWRDLVLDLRRIRRRGYALSHQEYELGLNACAVPVWKGDQVCAAINLSIPISRWSARRLRYEILPVLRQTAKAISEQLSGMHGWVEKDGA